MFNYTSQKQLSIFDFHTDFEGHLSAENRWVKMAELLDWDKLAAVYAKNFSTTMGASSVDARIVIGVLIIKHIEKKDDRGTIEAIQENPYMQYFLGLDHFTHEPVFDPRLFVYIRKRLGNDAFDTMNQAIISGAFKTDTQAADNKFNDNNQTGGNATKNDSPVTVQPEKEVPNQGKLQLDATVCDAYIKYPTDLNLLNESREKAEELLYKLLSALHLKPPRAYRRVARKEYLNIAKEKNERNHIEGKFGQGKAGYNLNKIMARLTDTHESWVASIVFVMNILRAMEDIFWQIFKELYSCLFLSTTLRYKIIFLNAKAPRR